MSQQTAFRRAEKQFKARDRQPDLAKVIDFTAIGTDSVAGVRRLSLSHSLCSPISLPFKVFAQSRPPAYSIDKHPGLIIIPNPFTDEAQRWIARKCLCDCTRPPNRTNLDPFFDLPSTSLFALASNTNNDAEQLGDECRVSSRKNTGTIDPGITMPKDQFYSRSALPADLLERLRWCTLGWQYNWTTKLYDLGASEFDSELDDLMRSLAIAVTSVSALPHTDKYNESQFVSQAGIINYYDERTTMAGHVDKTEENMDAPLISCSIGLTCVYLIGGSTRDTEPTPILLRSGDVLAMCGESRMAFHGVPRVLANTAPSYLTNLDAGNNDAVSGKYPQWHNFAKYMETHRINCNARKCLNI
ncbi:hypothetical protein IWW36_000060 [Coemansia brasiliensis]|uniref:Alpha-ketoglutarate-dependent dioxygenase AlkB-like domain-containing protein n=1 Tax=Coemansia brasiliensis TaxID=2650707 RepID=A0A9W8M2W4_9FUNG|nr:hypothetical protein IWW36_000060 [Coemansia brasiliensis]